MSSSVALVGGGIKGAVAAARYATSDDLVLLHVNFGQRSWPAEAKAVRALAGSFPSSRMVSLDLAYLSQLEDQLEEKAGAALVARGAAPGRVAAASAAAGATRATGGATSAGATSGSVESRAPSPAALLGLMPVLISMGVQCALRVGASRVVVGLSRLIESASVGVPLVEGQPQRRREFVHAFNLMVEALLVQRSSVQIDVPLMDADYAEVVRLAFHFELPVGELWTCEGAGPRACARCEPCLWRARAFAKARLVDPLATPSPMSTPPFPGSTSGRSSGDSPG